ncbi:MAG: phosphatase PAP2 family protein [Alphaproteobacteria bacterium]|nr:phosphatase PAP2 family protein [Alphaproteobacteria bacterium]
MRLLLGLLLLLLLPRLAAAQDLPAEGPTAEQPGAPEPTARPLPPLHGPAFRYGELGLFPRAFSSMAAIPLGVPRWRAKGWLGLAGVMVPVGAMMLPLDPSPDARVEHWLLAHDDGVPEIWATEMQAVLWPTLAVGTLATWGGAALADRPDIEQGMSLTVESVAVAQVYHLTLKMLIGREGPEHGDPPLGRILGPTASFRLFPAGTPSGHAATLFAMLGATQVYFAPPVWVTVLTHGLTGGLVVMHVVNHRHFASDSLWGSALGYSVGAWVVKHRSTRYGYRDGAYRPVRIDRTPVQVGFAPMVVQGGAGIGLAGRW